MSLLARIRSRIRAEGPISVADYMSECLLNPQYGYYATRDPFGTAGDFVTAPEISQMFGELIGLALAQSWIDQGRPAPFALAEAGPGRGTLMADALRATSTVPGFADGARIILIEKSATLRDIQAQRLAPHAPVWLESSTDLPEMPLFVIANEFFDALPVRQFVRHGAHWRERRVGLSGDELVFGLGEELPQPVLAHRLEDTRAGDLVEYCPSAGPSVLEIGRRINAHGGAGLIIDYGDWRSLGDTMQALRHHRPSHPLADPGSADLTAHVDFEALAQAAPCAHTRLTPQGVFLERLGITARAQNLARNRTEEEAEQLAAAHRRLTHPDEMGNLFKVLGLYPDRAAPPPGLNP